jgi:hypothetical protein
MRNVIRFRLHAHTLEVEAVLAYVTSALMKMTMSR